MPRNIKGGNKAKKGKNAQVEVKVKAPHKDEREGQEYAQVLKMLGNGRVTAKLFDQKGSERLCVIPGKFRKRRAGMWMKANDIILVNTREAYSDSKCDVIYKYSDAEVRQLKKQKQLSENITTGDHFGEGDEDEENPFTFENEGEFDLNSDEEIDLADL